MKRIGVLALQGSVAEHVRSIEKAGALPVGIKKPDELDMVDGLIIPGGESTTIGILLRVFGMLDPLRGRLQNGLPVWGTCAGLILLARRIEGQEGIHLGLMDMSVRRNGFGSQMDSFSDDMVIGGVAQHPIPLVFIRAPIITSVSGDCSALAVHGGNIVAARQKNMLATAFHPELTDDLSFHRYFIGMV